MNLLKRHKSIRSREGMTFIDPFDDYNVQAGQGTVAYEIYEQAQEEGVSFDSILVPVGGGGLISGVATYIKDVGTLYRGCRC